MKLGKHLLSYNGGGKSKFAKFPCRYGPQRTGVIICGTYKGCYISCFVCFCYSRALFSPSLLPKYRGWAKTRCVNDSSDVLRDPWPLNSGQLWSGPRWLRPLLTPERRSRQCPLCPSFHPQVWNDTPVYVSHSHLCRGLRHSSNFLPWNCVETNHSQTEQVDCAHGSGPGGPAATLLHAPSLSSCCIPGRASSSPPLLQSDSLSLVDLAISRSRAELSLS